MADLFGFPAPGGRSSGGSLGSSAGPPLHPDLPFAIEHPATLLRALLTLYAAVAGVYIRQLERPRVRLKHQTVSAAIHHRVVVNAREHVNATCSVQVCCIFG